MRKEYDIFVRIGIGEKVPKMLKLLDIDEKLW